MRFTARNRAELGENFELASVISILAMMEKARRRENSRNAAVS
jgi:hypothetical protein